MIARSPVAPARIAASVPWPPSSSDGTNATISSPARRPRSPAETSAPDRRQDRRDAALHVAGAAPVDRAVADLAAPRVGRPGRRIAGRDHVEVARQDDPAPTGPARPARSRPAARSGGISSPGQAGSARIATGSGAIASTAMSTLHERRGPPRPRPPPPDPVMLGIRTSAWRSATRPTRSTTGARSRLQGEPVCSATQDRPGHAGRPARAVEPDLGGRIGMDLAARRREGGRVAGFPRPGSRRRDGRPARCSPGSGTPRREPRPAGSPARRSSSQSPTGRSGR